MTQKNARWKTTQNGSIPYILFSKHFTEINNAYWAYRPASSTIKHFAKNEMDQKDVLPLDYFLIEEEHERRLDPDYATWKEHYGLFEQYTRLNFLMLLSSCFETYYRSVLSLALESKPATILGLNDEIDGAFILKKDLSYGDFKSEAYRFKEIIENLCNGDWIRRAKLFEVYFKSFPSSVDLRLLDEFRVKRNELGHFFGRSKAKYENPLQLAPIPVNSLSEKKLLSYFQMINETAQAIDNYLYNDYIGSYDIIKFYFQKIYRNPEGKSLDPNLQARKLRKELGAAGYRIVGTIFYVDLFSYIALDDQSDPCRFPKKSCIKEINELIDREKITFSSNTKGRVAVSGKDFTLYCKAHEIYQNELYCKKHNFGYDNYFYSYKLIEEIFASVQKDPSKYFKTAMME